MLKIAQSVPFLEPVPSNSQNSVEVDGTRWNWAEFRPIRELDQITDSNYPEYEGTGSAMFNIAE